MKNNTNTAPLSRIFSLRLTGSDRLIVKAAAEFAGVTESAFVRDAVKEKIEQIAVTYRGNE